MLRPAPRLRRDALGSRYAAGVLLAAGITVLARLPLLTRPLTADEAGYWLLARHWAPGASLYGDYWVDRPPLLLWLFRLGGSLSPASVPAAGLSVPGVRWLGVLAAASTVLLAGALAARAGRGHPPSLRAPVLAAALLCTPLLGLPETNGELLGVPFAMAALVLLVGTLDRPADRRVLAVTAAAGALGLAAALVKQNLVDALVFGTVVLTLSRPALDRVGRRIAAFGAGALVALGAALAGAAARGTTPGGLWDAVVSFRLHAASVIGSSASAATSQRLVEVLWAFVGSGAAAVLAVTAVLVARRLGPGRGSRALPAAALAMLSWEAVGVVAGGSYWLHYLTALLPGLVLLTSLAGDAGGRAARRAVAACVAFAVASAAVLWTHEVATPGPVGDDARTQTWLRAHAAPGDGVVVAFGNPQIVAGSGLHSPYPQLWSLPVRVRDPRLSGLRRVLAGPDAPRWIVVTGASLATWGIDPARAADLQAWLARHYVRRTTYGHLGVWERRGP